VGGEETVTSLTRFAPAPTGYLHLGHVVNALYVWGWGRAQGADVLLRIEDHDRQRARPAYERAILDDLDWLGFRPDRYPTSAFRHGPCESRQSDREAIYRRFAAALIARGLVYGCTCTRQDLVRMHSDDAASTEARVYRGTCRDRGIAPGDHVAWRLRIEDTIERFDDMLCGPCEQRPAREHGDIVIRDRHGNWTYQFAVTVDDYDQAIDLIIRGRDLLASTGLQISLGRLIGRAAPARFAHHALIMKSPTQKLSKSDRDAGVRDLRAAGWPAEKVLDEAKAILPASLRTALQAAARPHP
jgi:glutamyl-tRNA synthetase/glutamyl-Q tRNA(Asp) synthetase